jgi:CheY-like chemotaxis protein
MEVNVAASAAEALRHLHEAARQGRPFQVALVDSRMPGRDGFDLAEEVRRSPEIAAPMVMMLTSDDYYSSVHRCNELDTAAHLLKPVRLFELLAALRQAVSPDSHEGKAQVSEVKPASSQFRILLAEDNLVNQRLAVRMLERMGHRAVVALTGQEALNALRTEKFDLVLMDVQMPEMDGFAATREIRRSEQGRQKHIPVIAMTAHAMKGDRETCLEAGMDDYIAKPVNREELRQVIERVMKGKQQASAQTSAFD